MGLRSCFFSYCAVTSASPEGAPVEPAATPAPSGGIPQWAWIGGLIVLVIAVLLFFSGGD